MYSWKLSFQKQFSDSKISDLYRMQKRASKLFSTIQKSIFKACYCFRFNYYHSIRVKHGLYVKIIIFLTFLYSCNNENKRVHNNRIFINDNEFRVVKFCDSLEKAGAKSGHYISDSTDIIFINELRNQ